MCFDCYGTDYWEDISFEDVICEDDLRNILIKFKEVLLLRAFECAMYGVPRSNKEGFGKYIARLDRAFNRLKKGAA